MQIGFYHLTRTALEPALGQLLEKVLTSGQRAVVLASSAERVEALTRSLWTYRGDSFLPHGSARDGHAEDQPVFLAEKPCNPNGASVLVLVDGADLVPLPEISRVLVMFDGNDPGQLDHARALWRAGAKDGGKLVYWQQAERGGWQKARET